MQVTAQDLRSLAGAVEPLSGDALDSSGRERAASKDDLLPIPGERTTRVLHGTKVSQPVEPVQGQESWPLTRESPAMRHGTEIRTFREPSASNWLASLRARMAGRAISPGPGAGRIRKATVAMLLMVAASSVQAHPRAPPDFCRPPKRDSRGGWYLPYGMTLQEAVRSYVSCLDRYAEEQRAAGRVHEEAAREATLKLDGFIKCGDRSGKPGEALDHGC